LPKSTERKDEGLLCEKQNLGNKVPISKNGQSDNISIRESIFLKVKENTEGEA
jgi:hypothetical protein